MTNKQKTAPVKALFHQQLFGFGLFFLGGLFGLLNGALFFLHFLAGRDGRFLVMRFMELLDGRAVSTSFCLPVKKGWHAEQSSIWISSRV